MKMMADKIFNICITFLFFVSSRDYIFHSIIETGYCYPILFLATRIPRSLESEAYRRKGIHVEENFEHMRSDDIRADNPIGFVHAG